MSRTINSTTASEVVKQNVSACILGKFEFASETVYLNNSPIDITYDTKAYYGVGNLVSIEVVGESDELKVSTITLTLSGITDDIREYAAKMEYANRTATLYIAFLDTNDSIVGEPIVLYKGLMDSLAFDMGTVGNVQMKVVNQVADWNRQKNGRYTNEDQKAVDNTDTGLSHLEEAVQKNRGRIEVDWRVP